MKDQSLIKNNDSLNTRSGKEINLSRNLIKSCINNI